MNAAFSDLKCTVTATQYCYQPNDDFSLLISLDKLSNFWIGADITTSEPASQQFSRCYDSLESYLNMGTQSLGEDGSDNPGTTQYKL